MTTQIDEAIKKLKTIYRKAANGELEDIYLSNSEKAEVLSRFQPVFSLKGISSLSDQELEREFKDFLLFKNNKHWFGLHRHGYKACNDIKLLREGLLILLDEKRPIKDRLNELISKDGLKVPYLGRAILTAILQVAYPDKYGVLNGTTESAMKLLNIWPSFERGISFADKYVAVNNILLQIANELNIDLWTLDILWWILLKLDSSQIDSLELSSKPIQLSNKSEEKQVFGLEKHLHEFLRDNWETIELGKNWNIYEEDGDEVGYKYRTNIGEIDILAKHKYEPRWLVIELKRNQTSDTTVGQILRYMGWVKVHLAKENEQVEGLIISYRADEKIKYALKNVPNVSLAYYEVSFKLKEVSI